MKAYILERYAQSPMHIHAGIGTKMLYLPEVKTVLYREHIGTFSSAQYGFTEKAEIVKEIESLLAGKPELPDSVKLKVLNELDVKQLEMGQLISDMNSHQALQKKIADEVNAIFGDRKE